MNWICCLLLPILLVPCVDAQTGTAVCATNLRTDRGNCTRLTIEGNGDAQQSDFEKITRQVIATILSRTPALSPPLTIETLNSYGLKAYLQNVVTPPLVFNPTRRANCALRSTTPPATPCCEHVLTPPSACGTTLPLYRSFDGKCNNHNNPLWGAAGVNYLRLLTPAYADGVSGPRLSKDSSPLPCARRITNLFFNNGTQLSNCHTAAHMQWGQFLDHDITSAQDDPDKPTCNCCPVTSDGRCFVISMPPWDRTGIPLLCFPFTRKKPAMNIDCDLGPREHINQITAFIDASQVYGSSTTLALSLRNASNPALMRISQNLQTAEVFLPMDPSTTNTCGNLNPSITSNSCPLAGDDRVGEQLGLTNMHLFFVLLHNRIASQLITLRRITVSTTNQTAVTLLNKVFNDTRRIVGAVMQRITYEEYLPTVIGRCAMDVYDLTLSETDFWNNYDQTVNPGIVTEFAGAAFRYGHSTVMQDIQRWSLGANSALLQSIQLSTVFFKVQQTNSVIQELIKGMLQTRMAASDIGFTNAVHHQLFLDPTSRRALDLPALNIQRGRDLGIAGYTKYVQACQVTTRPITTFDDLTQLMPASAVTSLRASYCDPEDIDLFVGGMAETPLQGAVVGPTFACILGNQFSLLRHGDAYWHELPGQFTLPQLTELRSWTTGRLISAVFSRLLPCQEFIFEAPIGTNAPKASFPLPSLTPFTTMA